MKKERGIMHNNQPKDMDNPLKLLVCNKSLYVLVIWSVLVGGVVYPGFNHDQEGGSAGSMLSKKKKKPFKHNIILQYTIKITKKKQSRPTLPSTGRLKDMGFSCNKSSQQQCWLLFVLPK